MRLDNVYVRSRWDLASAVVSQENQSPNLVWSHTDSNLFTIGNTRSDLIRNRDWKGRVSRSEDVSSAYYRAHTSVAQTGASVRVTKPVTVQLVNPVNGFFYYPSRYVTKDSVYITEGNYFFPLSTASIQEALDFTLSSPSVENSAAMEFHEESRGAVQTFNGMTAFGQILEVAHGIRHPLNGLVSKLQDYQRIAAALSRARGLRGKVRIVRKQLHQLLGDLWLELSFGWQPLVMDIEEGAQALADLTVFEPGVLRVKGRGKEKKYSVTNLSGLYPIGGSGINAPLSGTKTVEESYSIVYAGGVKCPGSLSGEGFAKDRLGFGMSNFVPTVWELTPYSFLLDYFLNVSEMITAYTVPAPALAFATRTVTLNKKVTYEGNITAPLNYKGGGSAGSLVIEGKSMNRTVLSQYPAVNWEVRSPDFDSKRWLHILALLAPKNALR